MMRLAILRAAGLPAALNWIETDVNEFFVEDDLLIEALNTQGYRASAVVWSEPTIDWAQFDAAIIRSTFDYLDDPDHFLSVLQTIEDASCRLLNDRATVSWNINKRYLLDLDRQGVPVVPTVIVGGGDGSGLEAGSLVGSQTLVLKPLVGLAGSHLIKVGIEELDSRLAEVTDGDPNRGYLLQPLIESVTTEGEFSFVYFNSRFSYAVVKQPAPGDFRSQPIYGGSLQVIEPAKMDLDQANAVIEKLHFSTPLYARVDMVRINGLLHVMELELIEPFLYFSLCPERVADLVHAMQERLGSPKGT
jgi:glutathione synthase/RimK-type ligase-like ATP-grasp enzyme